MKQKIICIAFIVAFLISPFLVEAQIKGLLRDRAIDALKGDSAKDEEQEEQPSKSQRSEPNFLERKMMSAMGLNNVTYDQQYDFTSSMLMEIETIDSQKNKESINYTTFFNLNDKSFALMFDGVDPETGQKKKSTMIFDMKNMAMLILGEENGEKNGMAIAMPRDTTPETDSEPQEIEEFPLDYVHPLYKPTGRSKTILGLLCNEYTYSTEEGTVNLWATKENKIDLSQAYGHLQGFQALATGGLAFGMGTVMEMEFKDLISGESTHMLVKDMQPDSHKRLDISGYQIIGMGGE